MHAPPPTAPPKKNNTLAIVLSIVGGVLLICVILPAILFYAVCGKKISAINDEIEVELHNESNLRNLASATLIYLSDNDDRFPPAKAWTDAIEPYAAEYDGEPFTSPYSASGEYGYGMNADLSGVQQSALTNPDRTVLYFNSEDNNRNVFGGIESLFMGFSGTAYGALVTTKGETFEYDQYDLPNVVWKP